MRRLAFLLAPLFALSCGPTKSTTAIVQARLAIKSAESAEAQKKHPYEYFLAREYYVKAKEEAGYSQFELAEKLAKQASTYAKIAAGVPAPTPTPDPDEEETTTP